VFNKYIKGIFMKKILFISFAFLLTFTFTVESFLNVTKAEENSSEDYGKLKQEGVLEGVLE
jgi:hypothetical protein